MHRSKLWVRGDWQEVHGGVGFEKDRVAVGRQPEVHPKKVQLKLLGYRKERTPDGSSHRSRSALVKGFGFGNQIVTWSHEPLSIGHVDVPCVRNEQMSEDELSADEKSSVLSVQTIGASEVDEFCGRKPSSFSSKLWNLIGVVEQSDNLPAMRTGAA